MNSFQKRIQLSEKFIPAIKQALLDTYFSDYDQEFLLTAPGKIDIENNVFKRYSDSLEHVVPWLNRQVKLEGKKVLEIGCGTGSSTAALAHYVHSIKGYDIHSLAVRGARKRMEIMGLDNVQLHLITQDSLVERITRDAGGEQYDIILLFAVLEHQTVIERHDTLKTCWQLLAEGGILAVIDTPNILHYYDLHTSQLPFVHMLPNRIYSRYAVNSPRSAFSASFADEKNKSDEQLDMEIARWGRGVSYHDFEISLGEEYSKYLVAEGFESEILEWFPCTIEEEMLRWYVQHKGFDIPLGFTRCVLNLIFMKLSGDGLEYAQGVTKPPSSVTFPSDQNKLIKNLKGQLQEKEDMVTSLYNSRTWRIGKFLATPYRKMKLLFSSTKQRS